MILKIFKKIRSNIYILIPIFCVIFWAVLYLVSQGFIIHQGDFHGDFHNLYYAGRLIWSNPRDLYEYENKYVYLPVFASLLSVTFSLLPYPIANLLFYIISMIFGIIFTILFNQILILKDVKKKFQRFLFIIVISNGWVLYHHFFLNQFKYIVGVLILFVIKREIQYRKEEKEKDIKFYLLNYTLFVLAVGIFFYLIPFLIVYIFYNIQFKEILKIANLKKYCIIIANFIIQNILFLIHPSLIASSIEYAYKTRQTNATVESIYYLNDLVPQENFFIIFLILSISLIIFTLVICFLKNIEIEKKFAYLSLFIIYLSTFAVRAFMIFFAFILLLFIPFLKSDKKRINFVKENKIFLIGLMSIFLIFLDTSNSVYLKFFPALKGSLFVYLFYSRVLILFCIVGISLLILYLTKKPHLLDDKNIQNSLNNEV